MYSRAIVYGYQNNKNKTITFERRDVGHLLERFERVWPNRTWTRGFASRGSERRPCRRRRRVVSGHRVDITYARKTTASTSFGRVTRRLLLCTFRLRFVVDRRRVDGNVPENTVVTSVRRPVVTDLDSFDSRSNRNIRQPRGDRNVWAREQSLFRGERIVFLAISALLISTLALVVPIIQKIRSSKIKQ